MACTHSLNLFRLFTILLKPVLPALCAKAESFLNVAAPDQLSVLAELAGQEELYLAFYGDDLTYCYTAVLPHGKQQWQRLDEIISRAEAYWTGLPPEARDFDRAKALYMQIHP